jgi:hypothetical protein
MGVDTPVIGSGPGECAILNAMSEFDIPSVRAAISQLRGLQPNVFGSDGHGFQMNPVLSESEAAAFERDHRIVLPSDYRQFAIQVGNGGAGPFYGVFPLGFRDDNFDQRQWQENDGFIGTVSEPFRFQEEWNDLSGYPEADLMKRDETEYNRQIEQFEGEYWSSELMNGGLPICHEGCALRIWLLVTGEQAGQRWEDRRSEYKGLRPVLLAGGLAATFSKWYCERLDGCFATAGLPSWR